MLVAHYSKSYGEVKGFVTPNCAKAPLGGRNAKENPNLGPMLGHF